MVYKGLYNLVYNAARVGTTPVCRWVVYVHEGDRSGKSTSRHASCIQGQMVYSGTFTNSGSTLRLGYKQSKTLMCVRF